MTTPTPDAPTTPPASPAEASRPPDHSTPGSELRQLRAQLALCRDVLEDCRPTVKARIAEMEMSAHVYDTGPTETLLGRIEAALAGAPTSDTGGKEAT